jgi:hypothetical protein
MLKRLREANLAREAERNPKGGGLAIVPRC